MSAKKRIIKEIEKIESKNLNSAFKSYFEINGLENRTKLEFEIETSKKKNYYEILDFNQNIVSIMMKINLHYLYIKICINNEYPFKPPEVFINNKPYLRLLMSKNIHSLMKKCMHCQSILCPHRWGPSMGIVHIINEIYNNISTKISLIEILHLKKINSKYLKNIDINKYLI